MPPDEGALKRCLPDLGKSFTELDPRTSLVGLALSGGGIRSATFALGVLQALGERQLLGMFDYLSTVSGGGYTGGWWSAWLSRPNAPATCRLFPEDERLEPDRFPAVLLDSPAQMSVTPVPLAHLPSGTPDGSRSAWLTDPIHHLRLFSNYLTPRKGALSSDTWRAVTIVSRNLVLTWLILLPLLLAVVLGAQLYFAGNSETADAFVTGTAALRPDTTAARRDSPQRNSSRPVSLRETSSVTSVRHVAPANTSSATLGFVRSVDCPPVSHESALQRRFHVLSDPLLAMCSLLGLLAILWMLFGTGNLTAIVLGLLVSVGSAAYLVYALRPSGAGLGSCAPGAFDHFRRSLWLWAAAFAGICLAASAVWASVRNAQTNGRWTPGWKLPREHVRNVIVRWNARVLVSLVIATIVLAVAGFGHELASYLFAPRSGVAATTASKAGGWLALTVSLGSGLLAALRAAPSSREKNTAATSPGRLTAVLLIVAPPLVLAALLMIAATAGHWLLASVASSTGDHSTADHVLYAAVVGMALMVCYAAFERWAARRNAKTPEAGWRFAMTIIIPVLVAAVLGLALEQQWITSVGPTTAWWLALATGAVAMVRLRTTKPDGALASLTTRRYLASDAGIRAEADTISAMAGNAAAQAKAAQAPAQRRHRLWIFLLVVLAPAAIAGWTGAQWLKTLHLGVPTDGLRAIDSIGPVLALAGLAFSLLFLALDILLSRQDSDRSTWLVILVAAECTGLLWAHYLPYGDTSTVLVGIDVALIGLLVSWVIGLGWMADPNLLGLHNFYKARLVRAYLGASNSAERRSAEISDVLPNDDILLKDLINHNRGAPVHIINTTLNLVAARDLATAQRSAAAFTLSSEICGSARTGYRRTAEYMAGGLTLGTAVAASGAAVSVNMGSKTLSASLTLLLALFNVRLGFWAPTPNKTRWRERTARLWPFYLLREALSQTNELGTYCYLTDGGHFDNTGMYALVERGCRCILVCDDGADPQPCFSDMGEAIRRCRIDFGAEIDLSQGLNEFIKVSGGQLAAVHVVAGIIRYAVPHLQMLGWNDDELGNPRAREGVILWIKPVVTAGDSVDVRQYQLENAVFPQQTTVDQWFDESQFESYRALGYQSIAVPLDRNICKWPDMTRPNWPKTFADVYELFDSLGAADDAARQEHATR